MDTEEFDMLFLFLKLRKKQSERENRAKVLNKENF